jgi:hypothetical protein
MGSVGEKHQQNHNFIYSTNINSNLGHIEQDNDKA